MVSDWAENLKIKRKDTCISITTGINGPAELALSEESVPLAERDL